MKKIKIMLAAGLVIAGLMAIINVDTADAYTCLTPSTAKPVINVSGTTAHAYFTLPSGCKNINVTLVSYKAPNGTDGKPYDQQVLYKSITRNYNVEGRRDITIALPDCFYQVDLVIGQPLQSFAGGVTYHGEHRFLLAKHGGSKSCAPAQAAPAAPATPAAPAAAAPAATPAVNITNTNTNTATATNNVTIPDATVVSSESQPVPAKEETPKEEVPAPGKLPDTGPGTVAAFGFGSTFMSSLLFAYRGRFSGILDRIVSRI